MILESTTYPGTTEELLIPILEKNPLGLKAARGDEYSKDTFFVAFSPEREDPGNDTVARCDIPKVVGGLNPQATELGRKLYGTIFRRTVPVSTPAAAEMTKLLENIYRCVNIALVNELKLLSLRMGIDIWEVIARHRPSHLASRRFIPDLVWADTAFRLILSISRGKPKNMTSTRGLSSSPAKSTCKCRTMSYSQRPRRSIIAQEHEWRQVLVLGLAYKKDIDDLRESPSLTIIELLQKEGAEVSYNDPFIAAVGRGRKYNLKMKNTPLDNLQQYDCVLIVTDHSSYDYAAIVERQISWSTHATRPREFKARRLCIAKIVRC